jgi:hypothetical protein
MHVPPTYANLGATSTRADAETHASVNDARPAPWLTVHAGTPYPLHVQHRQDTWVHNTWVQGP